MRERVKTKLLMSALIGSSLMGVSCASTATGMSRSAMGTVSTPQTLQTEAPKGGVLAVIRYPAVVETAAQDAYRDAFASSPIGGRLARSTVRGDEADNLADSVIVKSNYFALSLYKELAAKLPEHSVLLSPHAVKLGSNGELTSEPITQAESLSSVISVDFAAYTFPDAEKMMGGEPLTFGDLITPLVTVRTDHRANAATQGVLLASRPLMGHAAGTGRESAETAMNVMQAGRFDVAAPELDFISYISNDDVQMVASQSPGRGSASNAVNVYPIEKIKLNETALQSLDAGQAGVIDPLAPVFSAGFADRIVGMLNDTDVEKASMMRRASAIAQFDDSLAALTFVGSPNADYQARFRYAERLLEAEQKYLSVQSLRIFDGIHNGEMGAQVRDMLKAEYDVLEKRRDMARKQNAATALAIVGAVAAGATISNQDGNSSYADYLLTKVLIDGAIFAGTQAYSYNKRSKAVGSNYLTSIVPALEEQTSVQVNLIDSNETITAIRFEDLKAKLQNLYTENQRSLDTVATRCGYTDAAGGLTGTWLGVCEGGRAAGTGVGVIKNADGTATEYYGYAANGQPSGPGYMIYHNTGASYSIEGNFSNGMAEGTMRVARAGQRDSLRQYQAGVDVGSGSGLVASPFNTSPSIN